MNTQNNFARSLQSQVIDVLRLISKLSLAATILIVAVCVSQALAADPKLCKNWSDISCMKKHAKKDHAVAQYYLARAYRDGDNVEQDYDESVRWYYLASEQGHADAQYDLAILYHDGDAIFPDDEEAFRLLDQAAHQGHPQSQFQLGVFYLNGHGTPYNLKESYIWTIIASKNGIETADPLLDEWERIMRKDEIQTLTKEAEKRFAEIKKKP